MKDTIQGGAAVRGSRGSENAEHGFQEGLREILNKGIDKAVMAMAAVKTEEAEEADAPPDIELEKVRPLVTGAPCARGAQVASMLAPGEGLATHLKAR